MSRNQPGCRIERSPIRQNSVLLGDVQVGNSPLAFALALPFALALLIASDAAVLRAAEAPDDNHWAYVAPQPPAPPEVQDRVWPQNELDYYVLRKLEQEGLAPTRPADKTTLIRRVTLDLTGLPPTPEQVAAFLADPSDDAYEKVVERLLHCEQYGERMAAWWLDLARYADTHGYEGDGPRNIWLYRDWVIDAFNRGLSFDRFTIEQLAGDLLPDAADGQRIATGFHRNTPFCYEAGTDLEQFRVESVVDRVNTTMTVWMGTTMGCAQCHDHKYDPFSQRDYYQLYAFFNNSADSNADSGTITAASPLAREDVAKHSGRLVELREQLAANSPELAAEQRRWEDEYETNKRWQIIAPSEVQSLHGAKLKVLDDESVLAGGENPDHDVYELTFAAPELSLVGLGIEVLKHESLPDGGPGRYESNGNFGLSNLQLEYRTPEDPNQWRPVRFQEALASYEETGNVVGGAIDDDETSNWCTNQNAAHATFLTDQAYAIPSGATLRIVMRHDSPWDRHGVGRFRLWVASGDSVDNSAESDSAEGEPAEGEVANGELGGSELAPLPQLALLEIPRAQRTVDQQRQIAESYRRLAPLLAPIRREIAALERLISPASTLVMVERDEPRETHIFQGGSFLTPGETVEPGVPGAW
ncbi:DUF1549 domain-containing protein, partial [Pirellulales bacterium]|nr:DUF1549 domain-containing protein [Pirellulales bacterium]